MSTFWARGGYNSFFDQVGTVASQQQISELCGTITRWGRGDDEKRLCQKRLDTDIMQHVPTSSSSANATGNCRILSLGCNGQWSFERLAFKNTPCHGQGIFSKQTVNE